MLIQSPALATLKRVRHAFFTREGGVSEGVYASLNGSLGSNDDPAHVNENRKRMTAALEVAEGALGGRFSESIRPTRWSPRIPGRATDGRAPMRSSPRRRISPSA